MAHDLRSPLGAIIGMLELFRDDDLTAEEIRSLSAELELSLRHNVNIMENLLSWAKQQMSGLSVVKEELDPHGVAEEIIQAYKYDAKRKQLTLKNNISRELKASCRLRYVKTGHAKSGIQRH
ncbi:MAG: histidine kinase dimerization/phospho-acceptor domain-containing protein [Balneolaceae bacterium]|nr:histidine kinase dimerization/phospho-acceptor domain-containing protein [Balneolaceae bacterium]